MARSRASRGGGTRRWQAAVTVGPRSRGRALALGRGFGRIQLLLMGPARGGKEPGTFNDECVKTRPLGRALWPHANTGSLRCLTFELSRHRRWDTRARLAKMYCVLPAGPAWHAVGARLERGVRQRAAVVAVQAKCSRSNFGALTRQPRWWEEVMASRVDGWPALTRAGTGAWESL